jgi:hypothetical protein
VVSLADAELEQCARRLARGPSQVRRRLGRDAIALGVQREHGKGIGILRGPRLHDVNDRIEAIRDLDVIARALGVEVGEPRRAARPGRVPKATAIGPRYGTDGGRGIRANPIVVCGELRSRGRPPRG